IEDGISAVADRMAARVDPDHENGKRRITRLLVDPRCVNTIAELGRYRRKRDPRDGDRFLDQVEDANNHAMDALRYAIFSRFGQPSLRRDLGIPGLTA